MKNITIQYLRNLTLEIIVYVFGVIFIVPVEKIIPKKKNLVALIGRDDGQFVDNIKYLYIYAQDMNNDGLDVYFLTENKQIYNELHKNKLDVIYHPTIKSVYKMFKTNIVVIDANHWVRKLKYFLLYKGKKIQLWHGIPLKKIQLENLDMNFKKNTKFIRKIKPIYYKIALHSPQYDMLVSTSDYFTLNAFKKAFNAKKIIEAEYPRNDLLINNRVIKDKNDKNRLIWTDIETIEKVERYKKEGKVIILYAPTFRETGNDLFEMKSNIFDSWSKFAVKNDLVFVIKSHPTINIDQELSNKKNILIYANNKDIYPLLNLINILITDYSSIYFDFLLLDKPIIFFPYDLEKYITSDKELRFDYDTFTPGPKCYSEEQLKYEILKIKDQKRDEYAEDRERIRKICFKSAIGNGADDIWGQINTNFITK